MTKTKSKDEGAYSTRGEAPGLNPNKRLEVTEKGSTHRAVADMDCYDCGNLINRGESHIISKVEASKGMNAVTHRYDIHEDCYGMVGQVVSLLGKDETHGFDGRPSLRDLWKRHAKDIRAKDAAIADLLEGAFGRP